MSLQPIGGQLLSIQTSPNDRLLWVLDNRGSVFVRTGLSDEMPVGTDWELVPGTHQSSCLLDWFFMDRLVVLVLLTQVWW